MDDHKTDSNSDAYVQSLVVPFLADEEYRHQGVIGKLLRSTASEPGLAIIPRLLERALSHKAFREMSQNSLAPQVRHALEGVGMLSTPRKTRYDQIGNILNTRYQINYWSKWRHLFGSEYAHALSVLLSGEAKISRILRSGYLGKIRSMTPCLERHSAIFAQLGMAGACALTNTYGELIDYGSLLDPNKIFAKTFPRIWLRVSGTLTCGVISFHRVILMRRRQQNARAS